MAAGGALAVRGRRQWKRGMSRLPTNTGESDRARAHSRGGLLDTCRAVYAAAVLEHCSIPVLIVPSGPMIITRSLGGQRHERADCGGRGYPSVMRQSLMSGLDFGMEYSLMI